MPVSAEDEDVYAKYLILYSIAVNNGYDCQKVSSFDYSYEVVRKNVSVWDGTGGVTVTSVTCDWDPNE